MKNKGFSIIPILSIVVTLLIGAFLLFKKVPPNNTPEQTPQAATEIPTETRETPAEKIPDTKPSPEKTELITVNNKNGFSFVYPSTMTALPQSSYMQTDVEDVEKLVVINAITKNVPNRTHSTFLIQIIKKGFASVTQNEDCDGYYDGSKNFDDLDTYAKLMYTHATKCETTAEVVKGLSKITFKNMAAYEFIIDDSGISTPDGGRVAKEGQKRYIMIKPGNNYVFIAYDLDKDFDSLVESLTFREPLLKR
jgi:hypothetical protein